MYAPRVSDMPIAMSPALFPCLLFRQSTFDEVRYPRPRILPTLPYTHADATTQPRVHGLKSLLHPCKFVIFHPAADKEYQCFLALLVAHAITSPRQHSKFRFQFVDGLGMQTQLTLALLVKVKGIAKKLLSTYRACTSLITIHCQEKLTLDKLRYAHFHPLECVRAGRT